jgi:hypothetical protein
MKREYLGDSYDAVKRLWHEILATWAPLHAEPRFIPEDIQHEFTTLTLIPMLTDRHPPIYSILNDPDTGIPLPDREKPGRKITHVKLATIASQLKDSSVRCVITFDQSNYRASGLNLKDQLNEKVKWLQGKGLHAFYYVSHAPFLFAFAESSEMKRVRTLLDTAGVPRNRIQAPD